MEWSRCRLRWGMLLCLYGWRIHENSQTEQSIQEKKALAERNVTVCVTCFHHCLSILSPIFQINEPYCSISFHTLHREDMIHTHIKMSKVIVLCIIDCREFSMMKWLYTIYLTTLFVARILDDKWDNCGLRTKNWNEVDRLGPDPTRGTYYPQLFLAMTGRNQSWKS